MGPRYPDWVFLATRAFVSDSDRLNSSVAAGSTTDGFPIQVSLVAADPPAVSHLRVHCSAEVIKDHPAVIFYRDNLILFVVDFVGRDCDYYIYKAHPTNPSLYRIPGPIPCGLYRAGMKPNGTA